MSNEEFLSLLNRFDTAMLVSRHGETRLRARPMAVAEATQHARLWFLTSARSGKLEELAEHPDVNVAMQRGGRYVSISGTARIVRDTSKAETLWTEKQRVWFPQGPRDPDLLLIEVVPHQAEYWDRSGLDGIHYTLAEARAIIGRGTLEEQAGAHDKIDFD